MRRQRYSTLIWLSGTSCLVGLALMGAAGYRTEQGSKFTWDVILCGTAQIDDARAKEIVLSGMGALSASDGGGDVATDIEVTLNKIKPGGNLPGIVNSDTDFNKLMTSAGRVKVVEEINYCGGVAPNIVGCAKVPGTAFAVVRMDDVDTEGVLWMHEYGHSKGLSHRANALAIMDPTVSPTHRRVLQDESAAFVAVETPPQGQGTYPQHLKPDGMNVVQFVHQQFFEGMDYAAARRFKDEAGLLSEMLLDPKEAPYHGNIAAVLGAIGDAQGFPALQAFIRQGTSTLSRGQYQAKRSALISIGWLHHANQDDTVIRDYLGARSNPQTGPVVWAKELRWNIAGKLSRDRNASMQQATTQAMGLSGTQFAADKLAEYISMVTPNSPLGMLTVRQQSETEQAIKTAMATNQEIMAGDANGQDGLAHYYAIRRGPRD